MNVQTETAFFATQESLTRRFRSVRDHTVALARPLSPEDCGAQSMIDASPVKWHMAHTAWFFETFLLERFEPDFTPHHPAFRVLFNSYYNGVGDKHARAHRGLLTRPALDQVLAYRRDVDERIVRLAIDSSHELATLIELGLQHEQQHQELLLTDVKHLLSMNPLSPAYAEGQPETNATVAPLEWQAFSAGIVEIGHAGHGFCFDNETPRHRQFTEAFQLASRLVTNGEFLAFIDAGGYTNPSLWLAEGWEWVCTNGLIQPLYWRCADGAWQEFTLYGVQPLDPNQAATHLSLYEADAYARWVGARLPTEAEWERAAEDCEDDGVIGLHPPRCSTEATQPLMQMFGSCWQWTVSSYAPYPGYATVEGALGEYNGKFMVNQYVLRGSSCVTVPGHSRRSYRNFFPATARWQFSGIRLAK